MFKIIKKVFRENVLLAFILQIIAISIVVMFYTIESIEDFFKDIGELKNDGGYLFSGVTTVVFGGIIPYIIYLFKGKFSFKDLMFYLVFWFLTGMEADYLYRSLGRLFGNNNDIKTISKKVLFDQFVYNTLWGAHKLIIPYHCKNCDYSFSKLKKLFSYEIPGETGILKHLYFYKYFTTLLTTWIIWFPCVSAVYSMPADIQIPLFNIVVLFFSIIVNILSIKTDENVLKETKVYNSNEVEMNIT